MARDFYAASGFDPAMILGQIAAVQSLLYLSVGAALLLLHALAGKPATAIGLEQLFSARALRLSQPGGAVAFAAWLVSAVAGGCILCLVVERAKKCLDFALTAQMLHLFGCYAYEGFPDSWEWWVNAVVSVVVMALLGEYLCMRREMREIPLLSRPRDPRLSDAL